MVRVRVVETKQFATHLGCAPFGCTIVLRPHLETAPWPFLGRVWQRQRFGDDPIAADQRAAALVRIRFGAVRADGGVNLGVQQQRHPYRVPLSSQNRSDRYFSPPSGKITTITESGDRFATASAAERFAPLEMPTNNPPRAS